MNEIWRMLIILGALLVVFGIVGSLFSNITSIPRLPGDVYIRRDGFSIYFPIATSIILSIALSLIINLFLRK